MQALYPQSSPSTSIITKSHIFIFIGIAFTLFYFYKVNYNSKQKRKNYVLEKKIFSFKYL